MLKRGITNLSKGHYNNCFYTQFGIISNVRFNSSLRYQASPESFSIKGFKCAGITAGLKPSGKPDMAMWKSEKPAVAAGCFTKNAFAAAPVILDKEILKQHAKNISTLVSKFRN